MPETNEPRAAGGDVQKTCCGNPMKRTKVGWYCETCENREMEPPNILVELVMGMGGAQAILLNGHRLTSMKVSPSQTIKDWLIEEDDVFSLPCVEAALQAREDEAVARERARWMGAVKEAQQFVIENEHCDDPIKDPYELAMEVTKRIFSLTTPSG